MIKILFIGDIVGKIGREAIKILLPKIKSEHEPDLIIANAENAAHGKGVTETTLKELCSYGIDYFTSGDHAFDKESFIAQVYENNLPIVRPANFPPGLPGKGFCVIEAKGCKLLLANLLGRVFMSMDYDCPFRKIDSILEEIRLSEPNLSAILVDIHAEATSEKVALGHYLDDRVSAVIGTHTHVMTADQRVSKNGTAYISDVGMVGSNKGVIGVGKENIIKTFLTQIKYPHELPETGSAVFNSVLVTINPKNGKTVEIKPIIEYINIK